MTIDDPRLTARFWAKVSPEPNSGCWLWLAGYVADTGYGKFWINGKTERAHRVSFLAFGGVIPDGHILDHVCRNRCCVNPLHLEAVTHAENQHRSPLTSANKTHCPKGHPYSGTNLLIAGNGERLCRQCRRDIYQRYRERLRVEAGLHSIRS